MTPTIARILTASMAAALLVVGPGCSEKERSSSRQDLPLRPLTYTEYPDLTPRGAAVREERLMRELVEGISWGRLEPTDTASPLGLHDSEELGEAILAALTDRDRELWESLFVSPEDYAHAEGVTTRQAAEIVDNQIGDAEVAWRDFAPEHPSLVEEGGLGASLVFESLELGIFRRIDGREPGEAIKYLNNRLIFRHLDDELTFEMVIPTIYRLGEPKQAPEEKSEDESVSPEELEPEQDQLDEDELIYRYVLGAPPEVDPRFRAYRDAGLHLKPQLLRGDEHPFPLGVGSFWRYRRYDSALGAVDEVDPLDRGLSEVVQSVASNEVIVEVREVLRYGAVNIVEILRAYDDQRFTRAREWWLVTARRLYLCDESCRARVSDRAWLLDYLQRETPTMLFPLRRGEQWGASGDPEDNLTFGVDDTWHAVDTPAGTFDRAYRITGTGPLDTWDRYAEDAEVTRYFVPGRGVVRRELGGSNESSRPMDVVEELVQYRLMN